MEEVEGRKIGTERIEILADYGGNVAPEWRAWAAAVRRDGFHALPVL